MLADTGRLNIIFQLPLRALQFLPVLQEKGSELQTHISEPEFSQTRLKGLDLKCGWGNTDYFLRPFGRELLHKPSIRLNNITEESVRVKIAKDIVSDFKGCDWEPQEGITIQNKTPRLIAPGATISVKINLAPYLSFESRGEYIIFLAWFVLIGGILALARQVMHVLHGGFSYFLEGGGLTKSTVVVSSLFRYRGSMQKLYCYVDESGQDTASDFFVVVAVITEGDQQSIREHLERIERNAGTNRKKWHKVRHENRMRYLSAVLEQKIAAGNVYVVHYKKPIPFFFPMIVLLEKAIKQAAKEAHRANVYVDGIDDQKAKELTNALRASKISLRLVKSRRDESEPLIRLADMWAGCIRSSFLGNKDTRTLFKKAQESGYLKDITAE